MKNLIKRLGSSRSRSESISSKEDENKKPPAKKPPPPQLTGKRYQRQQKEASYKRSQQIDSRSDSKSPGNRHQHHYQQSPRDSEVRDLFQFSSSSEQSPHAPFQQHRHQTVFRTAGASYDALLERSNGQYDQFDQHQSHQHYYQSPHQQPLQHEHYHHYPREFEPMRLAHSTSSLTFHGLAPTPENNSFRQQQQPQQQQQTRFEFSPHTENCRVRFLSPSSSVSSSFSEEPSQVHMMAGGGQSVASSSCMSGGSSFLFDSASKRNNSKGDLFICGKVARGAKKEENDSLYAMGMMSLNQVDITPRRTSPTNMPPNDSFEVEIDNEYRDAIDEETHYRYASPLTVSSARPSAAMDVNDSASSNRASPFNDRVSIEKRSEEKNEFSMTPISQWPSSYFR